MIIKILNFCYASVRRTCLLPDVYAAKITTLKHSYYTSSLNFYLLLISSFTKISYFNNIDRQQDPGMRLVPMGLRENEVGVRALA